jgi:hypothetical protein
MKQLLFLLSLISLLLAACGSAATPSTEATLQSTIGTIQATEPTETPTPTPKPSPTPQPTATPTSQPTPTPEPTEEPLEELCVAENCEPYQEIRLYRSFSDQESFSKLVPRTDKTFVVQERRDGRMLIKVTEPTGATWEAWADDDPNAYGLVGQIPASPVPPTPTLVPHRTEFRGTGQYDWDGQIVTAWEYQVGWIGQWAGKPTIGARVAAIDLDTGILTFDIGGQRAIQGRLAPGGRFQIEDSVRTGPTRFYGIVDASIYDFQVEDAVWIKGNSQDELQGNVPGVVELLTISGLR